MTSDSYEMSEIAKNARREYQRKYRHNNKEKVKKWNADYWERRAKKSIEMKKEKEA